MNSKKYLIKNTPSIKKKSNLPSEVDYTIDLHNLSIAEAISQVEYEIKALSRSGYQSLRVIHGGNPKNLNSIAGQIHQNLKSKWNKWVKDFSQEPFNQGSTIIFLSNSKKNGTCNL